MQTLQLAKQLCLNLRDTEIKFSKTFNILQLNRLLVNKMIHINQAPYMSKKTKFNFLFLHSTQFYFSLFNFNVNSNSIIKISNRYQLCLQIWILMSFQETLVSKKQKKQKKYSKCTKTKIAKKNKDCYLPHLYHCHNNKTRLKFITRIF